MASIEGIVIVGKSEKSRKLASLLKTLFSVGFANNVTWVDLDMWIKERKFHLPGEEGDEIRRRQEGRIPLARHMRSTVFDTYLDIVLKESRSEVIIVNTNLPLDCSRRFGSTYIVRYESSGQVPEDDTLLTLPDNMNMAGQVIAVLEHLVRLHFGKDIPGYIRSAWDKIRFDRQAIHVEIAEFDGSVIPPEKRLMAMPQYMLDRAKRPTPLPQKEVPQAIIASVSVTVAQSATA